MGENMDYKIKDMTFKVYFQGNIAENNINLIYTPKEKVFTEKAKSIMESVWDAKVNSGGAYNGDLIELIDCKKQGDKIDLYFDYTQYKYSLVNRNPEYLQENCYVSNHIAIPTIVKTKDNKFMFITSKNMKNGKYHWKFVGGFWEKQAPRIADNVLKEIEEEVGLSSMVSNIRVLGIATRDNSTSIPTMVDCSLTSDEIREYIENNRSKIIDSYEASEYKFIDLTKEAITQVLNDDTISFGGMTTFTLDSLYKIL